MFKTATPVGNCTRTAYGAGAKLHIALTRSSLLVSATTPARAIPLVVNVLTQGSGT